MVKKMNKSMSERRLVENQVFFRQPNEKIIKGFIELEAMAEETGDNENLPDKDRPIQFYCECSDEKCRRRILLKPSQYIKLHKNSCQFLLLPAHNIPEVERIVQSEDEYIVVEKYTTPPDSVSMAKPTGLDHK